MIKSYKLEELAQNDVEWQVLERCQQSALLRPWAKQLLLHPDQSRLSLIDRMGFITDLNAVDAWLATLTEADVKLVQTVYLSRVSALADAEYTKRINQVEKTYVFHSEGLERDWGYQRLDLRVLTVDADGRLNCKYTITFTGRLKNTCYEEVRDYGSQNGDEINPIIDYMMRVSGAGDDWDAAKLNAWAASLPVYER